MSRSVDLWASPDTRVGLDFGTTTTLLSITRDLVSGSEVIPLMPGQFALPSIAAYVDGQIVVGDDAISAPWNLQIPSAKRLITDRVESIAITDGNVDDPVEIAKIDLRDVVVEILRYVLDVAATAGFDLSNFPVRLGCPADWDGSQRQLLLQCANRAGLNAVNVDDVREEPIAAGLQFVEALQLSQENRYGKVLVFDMGGGTLDLALLQINVDTEKREAVMSVVGADGRAEAGDSLDRRIAEKILKDLAVDFDSTNRLAIARDYIQKEVFKYKPLLSYREEHEIRVPTQVKLGVDTFKLTLEDLESCFKPQMERAMHLIDSCLRDARLRSEKSATRDSVAKIPFDELAKDVQTVVLVGGMTQISMVTKVLTERIPHVEVISQRQFDLRNRGPEETVALGLAASKDPQSLNLFRPPFEITLEWVHKQTGQACSEVLFPAFTPIDTRNMMIHSAFQHFQTSDPTKHQSVQKGYIVVRTPSGEQINMKINTDGKESEIGTAIEVDIDTVPVTFSLRTTGRMYIRDSKGHENVVRITSWPAIPWSGAGRWRFGDSNAPTLSASFENSEEGVTRTPPHVRHYPDTY